MLNQGLYPESLNLKQAGLHGFRRGCNRRWELARIVPVVLRQQMGHTDERMTRLYSGEIPIEDVQRGIGIFPQDWQEDCSFGKYGK